MRVNRNARHHSSWRQRSAARRYKAISGCRLQDDRTCDEIRFRRNLCADMLVSIGLCATLIMCVGSGKTECMRVSCTRKHGGRHGMHDYSSINLTRSKVGRGEYSKKYMLQPHACRRGLHKHSLLSYLCMYAMAACCSLARALSADCDKSSSRTLAMLYGSVVLMCAVAHSSCRAYQGTTGYQWWLPDYKWYYVRVPLAVPQFCSRNSKKKKNPEPVFPRGGRFSGQAGG